MEREMGLRLVRRVRLPDGRVDEFEPALNADGYYVLADLAVDRKHNLAANQFYVKDIEAVAARIRKGGVRLRMRGTINPQQRNLIRAAEIEIEEETAPAQMRGVPFEDPFLAFTEWASEEDERAYGDL